MFKSTERANAADAAQLDVLWNVSLGMMLAGPDQRINSCNSAFTRITRFTLAEIAGRNCDFMQGPATSADTISRIRDALNNARSFPVKF